MILQLLAQNVTFIILSKDIDTILDIADLFGLSYSSNCLGTDVFVLSMTNMHILVIISGMKVKFIIKVKN